MADPFSEALASIVNADSRPSIATKLGVSEHAANDIAFQPEKKIKINRPRIAEMEHEAGAVGKTSLEGESSLFMKAAKAAGDGIKNWSAGNVAKGLKVGGKYVGPAGRVITTAIGAVEVGEKIVDGDKHGAAVEAGKTIGGALTVVAGAEAGAITGQFLIPIPVVGALVGGIAGGVMASSIGEDIGGWVGGHFFRGDKPPELPKAPSSGAVITKPTDTETPRIVPVETALIEEKSTLDGHKPIPFEKKILEEQKLLAGLGLNLGRFGEKHDGLDGKRGTFTKAAEKAARALLHVSEDGDLMAALNQNEAQRSASATNKEAVKMLVSGGETVTDAPKQPHVSAESDPKAKITRT